MILSMLIVSLFVLGAHYLLNSLADSFNVYIPEKHIYFPLILCHKCMTSIWGTLGYILISDFQWKEYVIVLFGSSVFNILIYNLIDLIGKYKPISILPASELIKEVNGN
jgi:hypothetical protein